MRRYVFPEWKCRQVKAGDGKRFVLPPEVILPAPYTHLHLWLYSILFSCCHIPFPTPPLSPKVILFTHLHLRSYHLPHPTHPFNQGHTPLATLLESLYSLPPSSPCVCWSRKMFKYDVCFIAIWKCLIFSVIIIFLTFLGILSIFYVIKNMII